MQITVDDDTFHKWAMDRGYVRLTDISEWARLKPRPSPFIGIFSDTFTDQVAALSNFGELSPEPTDQELTDALTAVLERKSREAAIQLLADFDTTSVKRLPAGRAREFLAAAKKAVES